MGNVKSKCSPGAFELFSATLFSLSKYLISLVTITCCTDGRLKTLPSGHLLVQSQQ